MTSVNIRQPRLFQSQARIHYTYILNDVGNALMINRRYELSNKKDNYAHLELLYEHGCCIKEISCDKALV